MTSYMKDLGPALIENGYLPIPLPAGSKGPKDEGWQNMRLTAQACAVYGEGDGVGLLCGQGEYPLMPVDIDTKHPELLKATREDVHAVSGGCFERVGDAPKTLLLFRAEKAGIRKIQSKPFFAPDGSKHQLEILGHNNQFVAYHVHPKTGKPYEWTSEFFGEPKDVHARHLPVMTEAQAHQLVENFTARCVALGFETKAGLKAKVGTSSAPVLNAEGTAFEGMSFKADISLDQAEKIIQHLSSETREVWLTVGMALHFQFDGSDAAYDVWDDWSSTATTYQGTEDTARTWASFGKRDDKRNPVKMGTVIMMADEAKKEAAKLARKAYFDDFQAKVVACEDTAELLDLARSAQLPAQADRILLHPMLQARFKELSGGSTITKAELEKVMRPSYTGRYALTELGNTQRMVATYGMGMMFVPETNAWYLWANSHWESATVHQIEALSIMTVENLLEEAKAIDGEAERLALQDFALASQRSSMFENMRKNAERLPTILHHVDELDANKNLFACANGVIDLETGKLLSARPDQCITKATRVEYDITAKCPLWEQTINDVFEGKEELIRAFQCAVGYSMMGNPTAQVLFIPFGNGANGKSTVFSILRQIFGKHGVTSAADTFVGKNNNNAGGPREDLLRLKDARFIYVSELDEGEELKEGFVKSLTGGEATIARAMHGRHSVEFVPTGAVWMPTNHLPTVKGVDEGIWRRLWPIPFEHTFTAEQRDPDRTAKLRKELSGILNWCLEGARMYQRNGRLLTSPEIEEARAYYKSDMDALGEFIEERCELREEAFTPSADLFAAWRSYGEKINVFYMFSNSKKFGRAIKARGFKDGRQRVEGKMTRGYSGIALKTFDDLTVN